MTTPEPLHQLVRASRLGGLPVVAIDGGEDVAEIRDIVFDGDHHRLVGFTLNKRGWFRGRLRQSLDASAVHAIGPDAVMVRAETDLTATDDAPAPLSDPAARRKVLGVRVLSADGTELGRVSDMVVSTGARPEAVGYVVDAGDGDVYVPISAELALSDEYLLLPASANAFINDDLAGFGASVERYRRNFDADLETVHQPDEGPEERPDERAP
ncbi:MAG: PRC-barrel domain-containing protein [Acidimicrobiales bacterium]